MGVDRVWSDVCCDTRKRFSIGTYYVDKKVTVQKIRTICKDEKDVMAVLDEIWNNQRRTGEIIVKISSKNQKVFDFEKILTKIVFEGLKICGDQSFICRECFRNSHKSTLTITNDNEICDVRGKDDAK